MNVFPLVARGVPDVCYTRFGDRIVFPCQLIKVIVTPRSISRERVALTKQFSSVPSFDLAVQQPWQKHCLLTMLQRMFHHIVTKGVTTDSHHALVVDSQVYLSLHGSLQDVFGRHAAVDLQSVEEHITV